MLLSSQSSAPRSLPQRAASSLPAQSFLPPVIFIPWAVLLVILISVTGVTEASGGIRVLAIQWATDFGANESFDLVATQGIATAFLLGAKHFNERRSDIIPALAEVTTCAKNITIVSVCDESGSSRRASGILKEYNAEYDVVVGMESVASAEATTFADVDQNVPVISHWASTTQLANKDLYPYFSRLFISDEDYTNKIAGLLSQLNFTRVAVLYLNDDAVPQMEKSLQKAFRTIGMDSISFPYDYDDIASIRESLKRIKDSDRNVIVFLGWQTDLSTHLHVAAGEVGLNSTENLWIFTAVDSLPSEETIQENPSLSEFLHGSMYISFENANTSLADAFKARYASEFALDSSLVLDFNTKLPPRGAMNEISGSCKNDAFDFQLALDYFQTVSPEDVVSAPFYAAYDAMIAIGLAACTDLTTTMPSGPEQFSEWLRALDFEGLSGRVTFEEDGDRNMTIVTFTVSNYQTKVNENGTNVLELVRVGEFSGEELIFSDPSTVQLRSGMGLEALPGDFISPDEIRNYLPTGLRILGYVEVALGLLWCVACLAWMYRNREKSVIRASQPIFMTTMVLGCMLLIFAILPLTGGDEASNPIPGDESTCMAQVYLFFIGYQLILASIVGKTLRAYFIFEQRSLYHQQVRQWHVLAFIFLIVGATLAIIIAMDLASPFSWVRVVVSQDVHEQTTESRGECSFAKYPASRGFLAGLVIFYALMILGLRFVSGLSKIRFVEERHASVALLQVFALTVPAVAATFTSVIGRFVILSTYFAISVAIVLLFSFFPKYLILREQRARRAMVEGIEKEKEAFEKGLEKNDVDILDALRIPMVQAKFARFAEENYVTESYLFVLDALTFKEDFQKQSNVWRNEKASSMMSVYIQAGSLLQVNISARCRETTIEKYKRSQTGRELLGEDLFDMALKEVAEMLNYGAWAQFVQEGGMYNVRNSLIPRSKVFGWLASPADDQVSTGTDRQHLSKQKLSELGNLSSSVGNPASRDVIA